MAGNELLKRSVLQPGLVEPTRVILPLNPRHPLGLRGGGKAQATRTNRDEILRYWIQSWRTRQPIPHRHPPPTQVLRDRHPSQLQYVRYPSHWTPPIPKLFLSPCEFAGTQTVVSNGRTVLRGR